MADVFGLSGSFTTNPTPGCNPSGLMAGGTPIDEIVTLSAKKYDDVNLDVDTPVSVSFGGLASASVLYVKTEGGKVRVRITTADGAQQSIPVDTMLLLISLAVPITAVDLTRVVGTATIVHVFLGQKA